MAVYSVTSASVGSVLVASAVTISSITMTQPTADDETPLTLLDLAAAPTSGAPPVPKTLFSAALQALAFVFGIKPNWPMTPTLTAPTWPQSLGVKGVPAANGIYVASCPVGITFAVTAA